MRTLSLVVTVAVAAALTTMSACDKKKKDGGGAAKPAAESVTADGTRIIPVLVKAGSYDPDKIKAKPNEKLDLRFTRVTDSGCAAQVSVGGGQLVDLPINQPVDVEVTAPASGKIAFACGMDMQSGVIIVE